MKTNIKIKIVKLLTIILGNGYFKMKKSTYIRKKIE
jgi:hypothetical protein